MPQTAVLSNWNNRSPDSVALNILFIYTTLSGFMCWLLVRNYYLHNKQTHYCHSPHWPMAVSRCMVECLSFYAFLLGPATIYIKNLDQTSFPNRTVITFSVATYLFRGIILNILESLRLATSDSMKHSKWDYVSLSC